MTISLASARSMRGPGSRLGRVWGGCVWIAVFFLLGGMGASPLLADEAARQQMRGLDEQVQEIKSDVLRIAAELSLLEERLLYPSNTQVAVFVSLDQSQDIRLDSVQLRIDGAPVAHHIYSFKELQALQKGGVQRIYTGNVATGEHQLEISAAGKLPGGDDFSWTESLGFTKQVEPKLLGITLAAGDSSGTSIRLGSW